MAEAAETSLDLLPQEALQRSLSFVLHDLGSFAVLRAVARYFCRLAEAPLSWEGAALRVGPEALETSAEGGNGHRFERLLTAAELCGTAFVDFEGARRPAERFAAERCFLHLVTGCRAISCLCVRNWCAFERNGLSLLSAARLPSLRHLELTNCDPLASYEAAIPLLLDYPELLSFRATFRSRARADVSFVDALPRSLLALGFVSFGRVEALERLFDRTRLEHLWLQADGHKIAGPALAALLANGGSLRTLSVPGETTDETCWEITRACPKLQLLCRMRLNPPVLTSSAFKGDFEPLPGSHGVVVRKSGSSAELASNGSLWAPYAHEPSATVAGGKA